MTCAPSTVCFLICLMAAAGPSLARAAKAPQPPADSAAPAPKILVAYYSRTGTTRAVAQELASRLGADLEEIVDTRGRKGF